ncbi:MAG: insulinase family protein [Bacteroidales bacterium]|jgi:zinc protease|nr:insulinase family protein [Bacteroidales bacterium]
MKKHLIFAALLLAFCTLGFAQTSAPIDPAWRMGTLENGMRYYIRHNPKPEGKAGFWIAHDIGALHEAHNQNGLAHFLEHLAFNGTKHFPEKTSMLEYLQSIGMAFGANINASTGQMLTQYMLTDVPLVREGIMDTCLLVLYDWAGHILCEEEALEAERGVIREEWRTRRTAQQRNIEERMRTLYPGTRYATRNIIGDTSIINNFTRQDILDFYHDWYRPNLQAVVIVGDFDVDMMEQKVIALFSTLENPKNPKVKEEFNVCDNFEPITNVYKDAELTANSVSFVIKFPRKFDKANRNTEEWVRQDFVNSYISAMLNARLREAQQQPDAKFQSAFVMIGNFAGDRDAFTLMVNTKNNELTEGFDEALTIVEQARRFGFTATELERAKLNSLRNFESRFAERNDRRHGEYNRLAYAHFQNNAVLMSEEQWLNMARKFNPNIHVAELNEFFKSIINIGPNTIVFASGPDKADVVLPDNEMLSIIMYGVGRKQLEPYVDVVVDKPLISKTIKAGKVSKETKNTDLDAIEWTLSNGMKVVLKQTPFRQDEIMFSGFSFGGTSLLSDADWAATRNIMGMIETSGVGEFDRTTLNRMMTGKRVSVMPTLSDLSQGFSGFCSPKDLETALQLVHLYFTAPRFEQGDFDITIGRLRNLVANRSANPSTVLNDTLTNLLNNYHLRAKPIAEERDIDQLSLAKIRDIYRQRFANPGAFTFYFVGNIDPKTAKPLIEKYLGSLIGNKKENFKDLGLYPVQGEIINHFQRPLAVGKASVNIIYSGMLDQTSENIMALNYLSRVLRLRYTEEVREKRGGTYGVGVRGNFTTLPKQRYNLTISFDTDPELMEELVAVIHDEVKKIAENGPLAEDFNNSHSNMKSQFEQNLKENSYWNGALWNLYFNGINTHTPWKKTFEKTDAKAIQNFAKEILRQGNTIEVVMLPE